MKSYVCFRVMRPSTVVHSSTESEPTPFVTLCFKIPPPPQGPTGHDPEPPEWPGWARIQVLATITELASSLPEETPMSKELHNLSTRALESAVAELGEGVYLSHRDETEIQARTE